MPHYSPELVESVVHDYVYTDKPVSQIAADHNINERDVTRIRHAAGIPPRGKRVRALPPAMQLLLETKKQLKAAAPPEQDAGRNTRGEAEHIAPQDAGGAMRSADCALPAPFSDASAIARLERLIELELAALEATRAELGLLARASTEAERCARTLSILSQALRTVIRLRAGTASEQGSSDDDDMPDDIDDFRNELARRIHAFVDSRTGGRVRAPASDDDETPGA